jgi:hypothetical protein
MTQDRPPDLRPPHFSQRELAERWRITTRTLDRWRVAGTGPIWLRINDRVLYRAEDVFAFEAMRLRRPRP